MTLMVSGPSEMVACLTADSRGFLASRRRVRWEPDVGEQFVKLLCGMGPEATENVGEIGKRIDVVMLTRPGEGIQHGRRLAPAVAPQKRPVPASKGLGTEHPFGEVADMPSMRANGLAMILEELEVDPDPHGMAILLAYQQTPRQVISGSSVL
jgi:hypothetical protein